MLLVFFYCKFAGNGAEEERCEVSSSKYYVLQDHNTYPNRQTPEVETLIMGLTLGSNFHFEVSFSQDRKRGVRVLDDVLNGEYVLEYEASKIYPRYVQLPLSTLFNYMHVNRKEKDKYEQEYRANGEGVFIYEVQDPLTGEE